MKKNTITRRNFVKISAIAGSMLVGGKLLIDLAVDEFVTVKDTRLLMGTIINLSVLAESKASGEAAIEATYAELERQVSIFDHREVGSPLAILNQTGKLSNPPQELIQVLSHAKEISEITNGAFDVTIKPLLDLYMRTQPALPVPDEVHSIQALVDYHQISISDQEIRLNLPGMAVTLDGIAKGYIVDAGTSFLKSLDFENVYVEAGGDLMASGRNEDTESWKVGIQSPRQIRPGYLAKIHVSNQAVATSGDYYQYFSADKLNHHIIDPKVGRSAPELASVTIVGENAMICDGLATAVMVLGSVEGLRLIESKSSVEGYLITKNLEKVMSSGFKIT